MFCHGGLADIGAFAPRYAQTLTAANSPTQPRAAEAPAGKFRAAAEPPACRPLRDYTVNASKAQLPQHSATAGEFVERRADRRHDGWYEREENNNWRPMAMRLVNEGLDVHHGRDPKARRMFHFSK